MQDCIFCKIISARIPADIVYTDDKVVAFKDIHPVAPVHVLIVPREHIESLADITEANAGLVTHMVLVANKLAKQNSIADRGYRLVINSGSEGGQVVRHLHMHLIGGRDLNGRLG